MNPPHPFEQLLRVESQAKNSASHFPSHEEIKTYCNGVKFHLQKQMFVVDSRQVSEILPVPDTTPLPDTQSWVTGVANIRGRIIPIFDLGVFFGGRKLAPVKSLRVMLVEQKNIVFGVIVDEVHGMILFPAVNDDKGIPEELPLAVRPFITGCFYKDVQYMVFSTKKLAESERFIRASI